MPQFALRPRISHGLISRLVVVDSLVKSSRRTVPKLQFSSSRSKIDKDAGRRIYLLSTCPRTTAFAVSYGLLHSCSEAQQIPLTIIAHNELCFEHFRAAERKLTLYNNGNVYVFPNAEVELVPLRNKKYPHGTIHSIWKADEPEPRPVTDEEAERPVRNFISTSRQKWTISSLATLKSRISAHTTGILIQDGMGDPREVNSLFPKASRPLLFDAFPARGAYQGTLTQHQTKWLALQKMKEIGQINRETLAALIAPWTHEPDPAVFTATLNPEDSRGLMRLHNFARVSFHENDKSKCRNNYLIATLGKVEIVQLEAGLISEKKLLIDRLKRLTADSIIGSMSAWHGCGIIDLLGNKEPLQRIARLSVELSKVLAAEYTFLKEPLGRGKVEQWVMQHARSKYPDKALHWKVILVHVGIQSDIEYTNKWIVDTGRRHGISCPEHESLYRQISGKTAAQREFWKERRRREGFGVGSKTKEHGEEEYRLDKDEARKFKKEQRQRDVLGNQEIPARYAAPQIQGLGNQNGLKIVRPSDYEQRESTNADHHPAKVREVCDGSKGADSKQEHQCSTPSASGEHSPKGATSS